MQNINIKNSQEAAKAYRAYEQAIANQKYASNATRNMDAFEAVEQVQYDRTANIETNAQTVMDNFEEYRRDMQEKAKSEQQQEISDEEQAREDAKEIARSLSREEIKKLRMMGIDVGSASLSDLMDIVNTMRDQAHKDELANILALAKVDQGDVSNLVFTSTGTKIAGADVDLQVGNNDILYLLKNKMPLNQENLYKAHYSGQQSRQTSGATVEQAQSQAAQAWNELPRTLQAQLQHIIEQAGIPVDNQSMGGAAQMLANDIPVTTDSMRAYMEMQAQVGTPMDALPTGEQMNAQQEQDITDKADKLQQAVESLTETDIIETVRAGKPLTIAAMLAAREDEAGAGNAGHLNAETGKQSNQNHLQSDAKLSMGMTQQSLRAVTALRQLEELRLSMTQQAAVRMLKQDINIDTRDLSQVVANLRSVEAQMTRELFARNGVAATEENITVYTELQRDMQAIGDASVVRLGSLFDAEKLANAAADTEAVQMQSNTDRGNALRMISVRGLATLVAGEEAGEQGTVVPSGELAMAGSGSQIAGASLDTIRRPANFAAMEREYDALGTAPRADMGDSIRKAFANVDAILQDMNLPADAEHERAVRILGYNSIAITEENLQQVLQYDREVNDLITACQPGAVLSMIRDGINPLDLSVEELNRTLRDRNYQAGVKETEDFATFLRDVERRGEISPEERSGYIGIYRVLKKLERSGDREAGYLFANGSRLTVRNLITAMRSRKAAGMDVSVDDDFGLLTGMQTHGTKMDAQIEAAFLHEAELDAQEDDSENAKTIETAQDAEDAVNPWQEIEEDDVLAETEQFLQEQNLEESALNTQAANMILRGTDTPESMNIYNLLAQVMKNLHFEDHTTEDAVDTETGAMARSLAGENIDLTFEPDSLLEQLGRGDDLSLTYADLQQQLVEQMYTQAQLGGTQTVDFHNLKLVQAGFRILGSMAKRQQYRIPVATEMGTKLVNLTLQSGTDQSGAIDIQLPSARFGRLSATLYMDAQGHCTGTVYTDTMDGNAALQMQEEAFYNMLVNSEYADAVITFGKHDLEDTGLTQEERVGDAVTDEHSRKSTGASRVATQKLCEASVFFVKAFAQLSDK
ncbi:DUF6240 domain-containing protein [Eubacterium sp. MSJ-33]|uniref:DUF6240 domain-containing protein n=1 Tax=Eubacterium sp. MSJ-33 TaxID=2841528 RepID=UPI001C79301A|nr:DUF6240 domain-containing protein [Eubacterium sp. MSJ-33]QWT52197.1 hypothetical protein KP625_08840 [Eubacterium sp. MSJ-33]